MPDIHRFNEHYMRAFRESAISDKAMASVLFNAEPDLVTAFSTLKIHDVPRLSTDDSTFVRQNFSIEQLDVLSHADTQPQPLTAIQDLNYKYLMLVRHLSAKNIREAVLRTGTAQETAKKIGQMSIYDIKSVALTSNTMLAKCHLSAKAVKLAMSENFKLSHIIPMMSIRRRELCLP